MKLRLLLVAAGFAAATSLLIVSAASGADNFRITGSYSFTLKHMCADWILVSGTYDEMVHVFYDRNGNEIRDGFTGTVTVSYTNLTTGDTFTPNSSGPGTFYLDTGETVIRGSNGSIFDNNDQLIATNGRIVLDENGFIKSIVGHSVNICEAVRSTPV